MLRWFSRLLLAAACLIVGIVALIYFQQHALLYHPRRYDRSYESALPAGGVEIEYTVAVGKQIAFYVPPRAGTSPRRLWVAFCGNGSLALDWSTILARYPVVTDAFLLIDYPGYGKCAGYATIASTRASADAALATLAARLGLAPEEMARRVCTIGHSLGSAVAFDFAARHPVQRIVALAPFTTLREESARVVGGPLSYLLIENYDNRARIAEILKRNPKTPLAIFHGEKDGVIPVEMSRELAHEFPSIHFFPIANAGHVSVLTAAHDRIIAAMQE